MSHSASLDPAVVDAFGDEWAAFDQTPLSEDELRRRFDEYFSIFPLDQLSQAEGFDLGCGSGRWDALLAPCVRRLHCIDPATKALAVARRALSSHDNISFHEGCAETMPLADGSQDFGIALGVLHHTRDPAGALQAAVRKLKPGAPFLVYLYYDLGDRPAWFRAVFRAVDLMRQVICRLPEWLKRAVSGGIATFVYFPLARGSRILERLGVKVDGIPLSSYRTWSFYSMRTDALDRFGTRIEYRFSRMQIDAMMRRAELANIKFSDQPPYWVACGYKSNATKVDG